MPRKKETLEGQENELMAAMPQEETQGSADEQMSSADTVEASPADLPQAPEEDAQEITILAEDALPPGEQPSVIVEESLPEDAPPAPTVEGPAPGPRRRSASGTASEQPSTPARRRRAAPDPSPRVLAIGEESKVQSTEEKEAQLWMEFRNSLRTKRPLTGILGGVERTASGLPLAIVYYKDTRIVIPVTEMNINLEDHRESSEKELHNRYAQILSWMMGAEIEFTVSGLDRRSGSVVASRADAMRRKQRQFFLTPGRDGKPLVQEGTIAEARVIAVSERVVRVEIFGVEFPIFAREVAWEWVDDCNDYYGIGDRVLVQLPNIRHSPPILRS